MSSRRHHAAASTRRGGPDDAWYDDAAGPIVRLYAMTGGRTSGTVEALRENLRAAVQIHAPAQMTGEPSMQLMQRLRDGLLAL